MRSLILTPMGTGRVFSVSGLLVDTSMPWA